MRKRIAMPIEKINVFKTDFLHSDCKSNSDRS